MLFNWQAAVQQLQVYLSLGRRTLPQSALYKMDRPLPFVFLEVAGTSIAVQQTVCLSPCFFILFLAVHIGAALAAWLLNLQRRVAVTTTDSEENPGLHNA